PMPVKRMKSHPEVRENAGKVALQRGPVVFCLEEVDNGSNLSNIYLDKNSAFDVIFNKDLLEGVVTIEGDGVMMDPSAWENKLYASSDLPKKRINNKAIQY